MQIVELAGLHPFLLLGLFGSMAFVWGLIAALGANIGYRRDLEWQTGFLLGLLFSGLWLAFYYSVRPLTRTAPVNIPKWLPRIAKLPTLMATGVSLVLAVVMEIAAYSSHQSAVNAPWHVYGLIGLLISWLGSFFLMMLGGYLGACWYNMSQKSTRPAHSQVQLIQPADV